MECICERLSVLAVINPASYAAGEQLSAAVPLSGNRRIMAVIKTGVMGASGTIDATFKGATSAGGTYTTIAGTAIVQVVKATGDNIQVELEIAPMRVEDLGLGYTHVKLSVVGGTAASIYDAVVLGDRSRYVDAALYDLASVKQKVTLV